LKIEQQELEDRQVQLTVEVPEDESQAALKSAAKRLSKGARIPGFRPGKAPYNIVVRQFGEEAVLEEALETLGQQIYRQAIEEQDISPFAPGSFDEVISKDPLVLQFTIPLPPKVDLDDYRALRVPYEAPEVSDEDLEDVLENLRQGQALIEPVERPAQRSDLVVADVAGELQPDDDGEAESLIDEKGVSIVLEEDADWPFPGIADHLEGLEAGSELDVEHIFPDDYPSETLRGRTAAFHLTIQDVKSRFVPQWSDDLARNLGEFEDLLDLRIKVRKQIQEQATQRAENEYTNQALDALLENSTIEFPPILLEEEIDDMVRDFEGRLRGQNLTLDDYMKIENLSQEELRGSFADRARDRLKRALALGRIVELEDLKVEAQEIDAEIDRIMEPFGDRGQDLRKTLEAPRGLRRLENDLLTRSAVDRLMAIARGELEADTEGETVPVKPAIESEREEEASGDDKADEAGTKGEAPVNQAAVEGESAEETSEIEPAAEGETKAKTPASEPAVEAETPADITLRQAESEAPDSLETPEGKVE
jgi:trigger factor